MADNLCRIGGIPTLGYGTWNRRGEEAVRCVTWALEAGYRHIDTAQMYDNEEFCGQAIAASALRRDDIFITTKVATDNYGPGAMRPSVEKSLDKLRVDQADLLLLHWPSPQDCVPMAVYVEQLTEIHDAGLTRQIGVSNFTIPLLKEARSQLGDRPIATNQVEIHVYMQNRPIVDHCRSIGVSTTAYCPVARGLVVGDPALEEIGSRHGATADQVAIAFLLAEGHIVIPSSSRQDRIKSNHAAAGLRLEEDEVSRLRLLDRGQRLVNNSWAPVWDT